MDQDFRDAVGSIIDQYMRDNIHTSAPAKVGNVSENFTAELTPDLKVTTDDDREVPYPKISGTAILMPTGAGGTIGFAFPVHSGDGCVAIFGEGGSGTDLKWDLSNATLLPGLPASSSEQVKRAGSEDAAVVFAPTATITFKKDCIELKKQDTTITLTDSSVFVQRGGSNIEVTDGSTKITTPLLDVTGNTEIKGKREHFWHAGTWWHRNEYAYPCWRTRKDRRSAVMALKDLALAADGDLYINETGDFEIIDAVRQGVQIRLRWIKGEWVFNTAMGTPYFETILVKVPNRALIEKALRDQILAVDGVTGVGTINLIKDAKTRTLRASFTATTTEGEIESEVELSHVGLRSDG